MGLCAECNRYVIDVRYHTPDMKNVFCDAYCSNRWYSKNKDEGENDDKET
jgi:hypothetical protein